MGNLADSRAQEAQAERLDLDDRDADVPLSPRGREQAGALAAWLEQERGSHDCPDAVVSSPFRRASETAALVTARLGVDVDHDERLRERDLGLFDGLTSRGIRARYPEEAERRHRLGKFYYQPPSGESWCDVVLRVRSLLHDVQDGFADTRLWLVSHQAVIMSFRFVLEELTEERLLDIDKTTPLPNASLTVYRRVSDGYVLERAGDASPLDVLDAQVTRERDPHQLAGDNEDSHA